MFAAAELGHTLDAATYARESARLRESLLALQYRLKAEPRFPVIVLVNGVDGAGKSETVNLLQAWMDPRLIASTAFDEETDEERDRPRMWRYLRALPPKGRIGIFFGSWYSDPIRLRALGKSSGAALARDLDDVIRLERMLVREGAVVLKLWFHISKERQRLRLRALEKDPRTRWRVTKADWKGYRRYDDFLEVSELALAATSTAEAPWLVIEGTDPAYRSITAAHALEGALLARLAQPELRGGTHGEPPLRPPTDGVHLLDRIDLSISVPKRDYDAELERLQGELAKRIRHKRFRERALVAVFEGHDAAGKGGAIRRVTAALDARKYAVVPIAAPTEEERAQPYLWRFWRHVPRTGRITIFDRSWYGRVLVERVEKLCSESDFMRAYGEINDFEAQLAREGVVVAKLWLAIDRDEQLRRFHERERVEWKRFKITPEDWRNRRKWDAYGRAVHDMVERTSTPIAPWTIVPANDKRYARLEVLRTLIARLDEAAGQ